ncbi:hypothetical protein F4778DRAFT_145728 [Xylariomycetidae sp. FL2044]|nr:hypothetical protein F4778DRAFT_145728 [Xylariomycetidae sp. FL2044]
MLATTIDPFKNEADMKVICEVGRNLLCIVNAEGPSAETKCYTDLVEHGYNNEMRTFATYLARVMWQISHRNPNMNVLEIGGGTRIATEEILRGTGLRFLSYTIAAVTPGVFEREQVWIERYKDKIIIKPSDIYSSIGALGRNISNRPSTLPGTCSNPGGISLRLKCSHLQAYSLDSCYVYTQTGSMRKG